MLIVLPPSEGKTAPAGGEPVELAALAYAGELTAKRERVLAALVRTSAGKQRGRALKALGLSAGQAGELDRNAALESAPTAPAAEVYTGVLYERLRLPELGAAARGRVLIASALWGVVTPEDRIPAYRLSISARLPRIARAGGVLAPGAREGAARRRAGRRPALRRLRGGLDAEARPRPCPCAASRRRAR